MTRFLSHTSFSFTPAVVDVRPRAYACMPDAGLTLEKAPNPDALALRHAP